jgi:methyl-accepting chemotaxis protein
METENRLQLAELDSILVELDDVSRHLSASVLKGQTDLTPLLKRSDSLIAKTVTLHSKLKNWNDLELMDKFISKLREYRSGIETYADEPHLSKTDKDMITQRPFIDAKEKASITANELKKSINNNMIELGNSILQQGATAKRVIFISGIIGVLCGILVSILIHKAASKPIHELFNVSKAIAAMDPSKENGDSAEYTGDISSGLEQAVKKLLHPLNELRLISGDLETKSKQLFKSNEQLSSGITLQNANLNNVVSAVRETGILSNEIDNKVKSLSSSLQEFQEVDQISSSHIQIHQTMGNTLDFLNSLLTASEQSTVKAKDLTTSISDVGNRARKSREFAEKVTIISKNRGLKAIESMIEISHKNKDLVDNYNRIIQSLGNKSSSIGQILDVIYDVAEQSSLLSLNASIIAAQAGEHGRGFSVVADEVRKLSSKTTLNLNQIEDVVNGVRDEVNEAVRLIQDIVTGTDSSIVSATQVNEVLREINDISSNSSKMAGEISDTVAGQAVYCDEILNNVTNNSNQVMNIKKIMDEQKKGSDLIVNSVEEIRTIAEQLRYSMQEQTKVSTVISETINEINDFSENLVNVMKGQSLANQHTIEFLDQISSISNTNLNNMKNMDSMLNDLISLNKKLISQTAQLKKT